jgi:hypothetical protein
MNADPDRAETTAAEADQVAEEGVTLLTIAGRLDVEAAADRVEMAGPKS